MILLPHFLKSKPILEDENVGQEIQKDYQFIETQDQLLKAVSDYDDVDTIVVDIETTSLSARTGVVIGIAISSREHQGHFISLEVVS